MSLSGSSLDDGYAAPGLQGFIPLYRGLFTGNDLLGFQVAGSWAKTGAGDNLLEGAAGLVLNTPHGRNWMSQFGVLYQHRHDMRGDLDFQVVAGTMAVDFGTGRVSLYAGIPISDRQTAKSEDGSTTPTSTSSDNTTTRTTSTHTDEVREARKTVSLVLDTRVLRDLTLAVGGSWYEGIAGHVRDRAGTTESKGDIEEERRAIIGARYAWSWLSSMLRQQTELQFEARLGQGKPEYSGGLTVFLGTSPGNERAVRNPSVSTPARFDRIRVARYRVLKETPSSSISGTCATTATVGVAYACTVTFGSTATLVTAPTFLSITSTTSTSATIGGTPRAGDVGSHTVKLRVRNAVNLDSVLEYTLTVSSDGTSGGTPATPSSTPAPPPPPV